MAGIDLNLYDTENKIFEKYPEYEDKKFVCDGLCWSDIFSNPESSEDYKRVESIYLNSKRRISFFAKEPNGNGGEDYRDWHWSDRKSPYNFGDSISTWLRGLLSTTQNAVPSLEASKKSRDIFKSMPFAIVNAKKLANEKGGKCNISKVFSFASEHANLLREQFKLLNSNIIVCCGSSNNSRYKWKMLNLAKDIIFPEYNFVKVNNFCYYCESKNLLLIDSFHPSSTENYTDKFDSMFHDFQNFLIRYNNPF